ncbi:DUF2497 domain-containing protein [Aquibium sp. A9E412]|uniref:DUF2497 domain-containing protein n=1 Tax=Aquibium sp. A9E412 TaxID=2976767 RepID=UPI0025AFAB06|nr:DUF2497 domain-containing protein [Aquibium sp. A9E412]MDN2564831.1 DUF2497 domain-containing protein [Aquibium sp. A9E412]
MGQPGSAQREPSMEEILASIRRIIEDSDTARKDDAASGVPADSGGAGDSPAMAEVESFRAEFRALHQAAPREAEAPRDSAAAHEDGDGDAPAAAADSAAPAGDPAPAFGEAAAPSAPRLADTWSIRSAPAEAAAARPAEPPRIVRAEPPSPTPDAAVDELARPSAETEDEDVAPVSHAASGDDEPAHWEPAEPAPAAVREPSGRPALISDAAGRKVAAAFEELNGAFEASRRKSFDEMAEAMLRPMLQEWLDDNLPTLVERLVREEIERVARGAQ